VALFSSRQSSLRKLGTVTTEPLVCLALHPACSLLHYKLAAFLRMHKRTAYPRGVFTLPATVLDDLESAVRVADLLTPCQISRRRVTLVQSSGIQVSDTQCRRYGIILEMSMVVKGKAY